MKDLRERISVMFHLQITLPRFKKGKGQHLSPTEEGKEEHKEAIAGSIKEHEDLYNKKHEVQG